MQVTRPALRYYGGKFRLAPWIIEQFPHHECYVEPFCGAANVFLRKSPVEFEVLNDLDGEVVNFFKMLRDRTDELIRSILATPYSRAEYDAAWYEADDPLERARRYYVRAWQGWGGGKGWRPSGWRYQHSNNRGKSVLRDWSEVEHLPAIVERLKAAFIESDDALNVIERFDQPHTLFYLDPPYLDTTRSECWADGAYKHEIGLDYHIALLDVLQEIEGMAVISGYPSDVYEERLSGWRRLERSARTTNTAKQATEVLWVSPAAVRAGQRTLFRV